ncbi:MAG: cation:proton antiporter [Lachnospiraceae bacterium]
MLEWIRFGLTAVLLLGGVFAFAAAMLGNYRFGYVLNRMHGAGIGDSLGVFLVIGSLIISADSGMDMLKLGLLVVFLWCTSPVTSHVLARIEMGGDREYRRHLRDLRKKG